MPKLSKAKVKYLKLKKTYYLPQSKSKLGSCLKYLEDVESNTVVMFRPPQEVKILRDYGQPCNKLGVSIPVAIGRLNKYLGDSGRPVLGIPFLVNPDPVWIIDVAKYVDPNVRNFTSLKLGCL